MQGKKRATLPSWAAMALCPLPLNPLMVNSYWRAHAVGSGNRWDNKITENLLWT